MKYGHAILSTDRVDTLKRLLESMKKFTHPKKLKNVFVFDDSGTYKNTISDLCSNYSFVEFVDTGNRIAIAKNSNRAIRYMYDKFDMFTVMNNDVEVLRRGWYNFYFEAMNKTGIHHFSFRQIGLWGACEPKEKLKKGDKPHVIQDIFGVKVATIQDKPHGAILTFDKELVNKVGYFDAKLFKGYGQSHNDYQNRVSISNIQVVGIHDVYGSNEYFKVHDIKSITPTREKIKNFQEAKQIFNSVKNKTSRIYIPYA